MLSVWEAIRMVDRGAVEGGACVDSSRRSRPSVSWLSMQLSTIYSTWADI